MGIGKRSTELSRIINRVHAKGVQRVHRSFRRLGIVKLFLNDDLRRNSVPAPITRADGLTRIKKARTPIGQHQRIAMASAAGGLQWRGFVDHARVIQQ